MLLLRWNLDAYNFNILMAFASCAQSPTTFLWSQQVCDWKLYPLMSDTRQLMLQPHRVDGVYGQDAQQNAEWEIVSVVDETCDFNISSGSKSDTMSCIRYR